MLEPRLDAIGRDAGSDHPGLPAGWLVEKLAWLAACAVAAALVHDGSVPPLDPEETSLAFGAHELPERLAVSPHGWVEPDAAGEDERLASALERLEVLLTPVVDALVERRMRPGPALWRQAGDQLAASFLWWGQALHRLDEGQRLGERILALDSRLAVAPGFTTTDMFGPTMPWRMRASCCLAYHVPERALCAYCPRLRKAGEEEVRAAEAHVVEHVHEEIRRPAGGSRA